MRRLLAILLLALFLTPQVASAGRDRDRVSERKRARREKSKKSSTKKARVADPQTDADIAAHLREATAHLAEPPPTPPRARPPVKQVRTRPNEFIVDRMKRVGREIRNDD